jgi:predicted O-methyltransferase YrrM
MSNTSYLIPDTLYPYFHSVSLKEPALLKELREVTANEPRGLMQLPPEQGQFLQLLVKLIGAKKCLEVGVFTGYSSLAVALALPADGKIIACDVSVEWTNIARRFWQRAGVADKIDLRLAPGVETLDRLLAEGHRGTFDFAFIDADKTNYWNYYERAYELVRGGGLIGIDNTLWYGKPVDLSDQSDDTVAIREFNRKLYRDERVIISLLPIGDGLTLALKAGKA